MLQERVSPEASPEPPSMRASFFVDSRRACGRSRVRPSRSVANTFASIPLIIPASFLDQPYVHSSAQAAHPTLAGNEVVAALRPFARLVCIELSGMFDATLDPLPAKPDRHAIAVSDVLPLRVIQGVAAP